ncbi:MAG TPA: ABC transporter ATP-binding protein, partial [Magnetovibrio sp.]
MNKPSIIQRARESLNTTRQLANLLAPQKGKVFLFLAISVLASVSEGVSISLLIPILETMSSGSSMSSVPVLGEVNSYFQRYDPEIRLQFVAGSMFAIIVARGAFLYLASYLASTMPLQVRYELITQMYRDLIATRLSYLHGQDSGALLNNLLSQPNRISGAIGSFTSMVVNALVIGVYVLLMLAMSWQLTFISLAFMFVLSLIVRKFMNRSIRLRGEQVTNLYEQAHQVMYETLNGIKQILLSSAQPVMQHHFANIARSELEARYGQERLQQGIFPIFTIASGGLICSLILLSSLGQSLDLSAVILFTFVLFRLMSPVSAINNASASLQSNIHAFTDITKFQNQLNLAKQPSGDIPYRTLRDKIVFDDVSFHYDTANEPTLEHVSFSIPKSAMVAIVGPSGAGKSTITNLLANFYEPTSGKILIDDVNLRDLDLDSWRRCIGLVS